MTPPNDGLIDNITENIGRAMGMFIALIALPFLSKIAHRAIRAAKQKTSPPNQNLDAASPLIRFDSATLLAQIKSQSTAEVLSEFCLRWNESREPTHFLPKVCFADNRASTGHFRVESSWTEDIHVLFTPDPLLVCVQDDSEEPIASYILREKPNATGCSNHFANLQSAKSVNDLFESAKELLPLFQAGHYLLSLRRPKPEQFGIIDNFLKSMEPNVYSAESMEDSPIYIATERQNTPSDLVNTYVEQIRNGARPVVTALNNASMIADRLHLFIGTSWWDFLQPHDAYILDGHEILRVYLQLGIRPNILLFSRYLDLQDTQISLLEICQEFLNQEQMIVQLKKR